MTIRPSLADLSGQWDGSPGFDEPAGDARKSAESASKPHLDLLPNHHHHITKEIMTNLVTVYCTKYALTYGIFRLTGRITGRGAFEEVKDRGQWYYLRKTEYRLNREDALADFEKRRAAKIASLHRQIAKLERMKPTIKDDTTTEAT